MVSEKGPGFGWSVLQPDWSMILNVIIQYIYICGNNYCFGGTRVE
jgi:hypothetical protein